MRTRGRSKKRTEDPETEEDRREHKEETAKDSGMEQQAGDNEEARGGLSLLDLMDFMTEQKKKQMNDKFDRNDESLRQIKK